jgi:hypothetical protein
MIRIISRNRALVVLVITVYVASCFLAGCDNTAVRNDKVFSTAAEQMRVTSPNGRLDAVLVNDPYGPAAGGGIDSNVYITAKGSPIHTKTSLYFFRADPLAGGKLVWHGDHLLEIHYDIADIHEFRNLWGLHEIQDTDSTGERDFEVEIRLVPSSPDFSLLDSDGKFRSRN